MEKWNNKIAVVTGASAGIGAAIVRDLANNGVNVIGLARRVEKIEEISKELKDAKGKIYFKKCDLSDLNSVTNAFKYIEEQFGEIHILINNAGMSTVHPTLSEEEGVADKINQVIDVNFKSMVHCTRLGVKLMKNNYGMIVNISSILDSVIPFDWKSNIYSATKAAVKAFSEIIRQELIVSGKDKIRITNLSPGLVKTEIIEASGYENSAEIYDGRAHLQPKDISDGVLYLLSTPFNVNVSQITIKPVGETC